MTTLDLDGLMQWMNAVPRMRAHHLATEGRPLRMPETADELLLRRGRLMEDRVPLPEQQVYPKSQQCYLNAFRLFKRRKGLRYCEGNLLVDDCPIPVMHGWCIDGEGRVLDPSVDNDRNALYFGIEYKDDFVYAMWKRLARLDSIGILPNAFLLRDRVLHNRADEGWLEQGIVSNEEKGMVERG